MKLGIVMEGGASRTLFSCGVTDVFLEENIMPDYFVGVSAGIAYGVSYLSKQKGRNLTLAQQYMGDKRYMGMRHLFHRKNKCFYNIPFVFDEIPHKHLPFDYEAFQEYSGKVVATVTNIHTGKAEYIEVPRGKEHKDILVASCALPILFQPVKIGKRYYLDGGLADSIPFKQAFKEGCDKVIVILTRERGYKKESEHGGGLISKLYKKYPKIVEDVRKRPQRYNACLQELFEAEQRGEVFVIAPKDTFGVGRTEAGAEKLTQLYEEGVRQAREQMDDLRKFLEG